MDGRRAKHGAQRDGIARTIRGLKGQGLDSWEKVAARLNAMGSKTMTDMRWDQWSLEAFVRAYRLSTGERLHPEVSGAVHRARLRVSKIGISRAVFSERREQVADALRGLAGQGLDKWEKVANRLNADGIAMLTGKRWTAVGVCHFVHAYKLRTGERLHPEVSITVHTARLRLVLTKYREKKRAENEARGAQRESLSREQKEQRRRETVERMAQKIRAALVEFTMRTGPSIGEALAAGCKNAVEIASWLNRHKVASRHGHPWTEHSVRDVGARYERLTGVRVLTKGGRKRRQPQ